MDAVNRIAFLMLACFIFVMGLYVADLKRPAVIIQDCVSRPAPSHPGVGI